MYLEERIEQLEQVSIDYGRQIETVAKGLAELTTDVRAIRQDMNDGFARIDEQFAHVDKQFVRVDEQFAGVRDEFVRINKRFDQMQQTQLETQQVQQLILKLLTERLS